MNYIINIIIGDNYEKILCNLILQKTIFPPSIILLFFITDLHLKLKYLNFKFLFISYNSSYIKNLLLTPQVTQKDLDTFWIANKPH